MLGLMVFLLLGGPATGVGGSTGVVYGRVTTEYGDPLPYANVVIMGTSLGDMTTHTGEYRIRGLAPGDTRLRVSYLGWKTRDLELFIAGGETTEVNVMLEEVDPWSILAANHYARPRGEEVDDLDSLRCPCSVESWAMRGDGGRSGFIQDSRNRFLRVTWEGEERAREPGEPPGSEPRLVYVEDIPGFPLARALPMGGGEEARLIEIFDTWVHSQIPADSLAVWLLVCDAPRPWVDRKDRLSALSVDQFRALVVWKTSRFLDLQRELGRPPGPEDW